MDDFRVSVAMSAEQSLDAIARTAEFWHADWHREGSGGQLELPVHAGLRRGVLSVQLSTESVSLDGRDGTALVARVKSSHYQLQGAAVSILAIGGLGALALTLWPLYPPLLALAPVSLILVVVAWLAIASRLRNSGLEEFLDLVASAANEDHGTHPLLD